MSGSVGCQSSPSGSVHTHGFCRPLLLKEQKREDSLRLQVGDKCRIRDRATIMARHVYADRGDAFADQQVHGHVAGLLVCAACACMAVGAPAVNMLARCGRAGASLPCALCTAATCS